MADLTQQIELSGTWTNVSTVAALEDDATYGVDIELAENNATIYWALTDDGAIAPTVPGHPILPANRVQPVDYREVTQKSGQFLWMRTDRGSAQLSITKD